MTIVMAVTGDNIKRLRKAMEISARILGERLDIPKGRIEAWERGDGNPKLDDVATICRYFGITQEVLRDKLITMSEAERIVETIKRRDHDGSKKHEVSEDEVRYFTTQLHTNDDVESVKLTLQNILYMGKLLRIPLAALLALQQSEKDNEKKELISEVIAYKKEIETLREKTEMQQTIINLQKDKLKSLEK